MKSFSSILKNLTKITKLHKFKQIKTKLRLKKLTYTFR